ncbi:MAG: pantetheine-phosphate adenylyltransferase [Gammaproteobacteria bacterium]|nr:pantetheine-phosphate adenylyltransferase [Gammaproteobacteria bacterium]
MSVSAIYPGTFDPLTLGHADIVHRASLLFDKVVVAISASPGKTPLFTLDERISLAREALKPVSGAIVTGYDGLTVNFARKNDLQVIVRGLRAVSDFEYESQLATMNRNLTDEVETVFLTPTENFACISSSLVREVAKFGGDVEKFVHPRVADALRIKFGK